MNYTAKVTLKYDATWEGKLLYNKDRVIPEEHFTFEVPAEDLNTIQLFQLFEKFCYAMGHNSVGIAKGAAYVAFNDMLTTEEMRKTADEYDLVLVEDHLKKLEECEISQGAYVAQLETQVLDLKAKLSRFENPYNPNYTEEEMDAMSHEVADLLPNKLQGSRVVCEEYNNK
jgi:hypothetical protein